MNEPVRVEPMDQFNQVLVDNVHPGNWVNPKPADRYNLVVIGAGSGGLVTALGAAGLGARVAIVERYLIGGDCLNVGCVPSKCLIASARAAASVRQARAYGVAPGDGAADFPAVMERLRRLRSGISRNDSAYRLAEAGVHVFLGQGRFVDGRTLEVNGAKLRFSKAVLATGARAAVPDIEGLCDAGFHTNETVFALTELPRRLGVLGGGPIGCELAQAFARLGSEVTIIDHGPQLLHREDEDAAMLVREALTRDGVHHIPAATVIRVNRVESGKMLHVSSEQGEQTVEVDEILVGAGRVPNVEDMGLDRVDVGYDEKHGVQVDDRLRTANRRVYAIGDCCSRYKFTHASDAMARMVLRNALFAGRAKFSDLVIPWCTYTDPEVAHVGLYPRQAAERGMEIDTFVQPLADVDRAIADGQTDGFVKVHVKRGSDRIVGATIVSAHAGDLISQVTQAMVTKVGLSKIASVIHPYPTQAEAFRKTADAYSRSRLTPTVKKLFGAWLKSTR